MLYQAAVLGTRPLHRARRIAACDVQRVVGALELACGAVTGSGRIAVWVRRGRGEGGWGHLRAVGGRSVGPSARSPAVADAWIGRGAGGSAALVGVEVQGGVAGGEGASRGVRGRGRVDVGGGVRQRERRRPRLAACLAHSVHTPCRRAAAGIDYQSEATCQSHTHPDLPSRSARMLSIADYVHATSGGGPPRLHLAVPTMSSPPLTPTLHAYLMGAHTSPQSAFLHSTSSGFASSSPRRT